MRVFGGGAGVGVTPANFFAACLAAPNFCQSNELGAIWTAGFAFWSAFNCPFNCRNENGTRICGAKIRPGFDVVAESVGLETKMNDVDLVITGEGSLDRQTLEGKTPAGVAQLARKLGKRVFAMVGRTTDETDVRKLFDGVYQNARSGMSQEENMKRAAQLLRENARELAKTL